MCDKIGFNYSPIPVYTLLYNNNHMIVAYDHIIQLFNKEHRASFNVSLFNESPAVTWTALLNRTTIGRFLHLRVIIMGINTGL